MTRRLHKAPAEPVPSAVDESTRVVARPDGYYWIADDGRQEFGPFATAAMALLALREGLAEAREADERLAEAESEIGIAEWDDPDTGQPAEDVVTRIEEH